MASKPRILSLADYLTVQTSNRSAAEEPEARVRRMPSPRLQRTRVQVPPREADEPSETFRHRGLLRRAQALQAQPIELTQEIWTQEDDVLRLAPEETTPPPIDEAALRAALEAEWQQRLQEATARARAEGEASGRAAAEAEWSPRLQTLQDQLTLELERLRRAWAEYTRRLEPMLVELALEIAETLLDAPLPESIKGVSARTLTEAIEQLAHEAPLEVTLHPVDFLRLQEQGVVSQLDNRHPDLHWNLDPSLNEGDWIVQTPAAMQRRIRREMLQRLRQRLGLSVASDDSSTTHPPAPADET